ncbi:hypothetical protein GWI33_020543 [Rhynchophorus ferrugineus]|uniref:Uncharacterized protein n=1 Tax=Rhynchophorus ferrugineus TaxID=354439 RepID=A0A834HU76_RHYFE|nr:hypothetical protein GWI33_020543 [Rhynchophorus ferrugineus]
MGINPEIERKLDVSPVDFAAVTPSRYRWKGPRARNARSRPISARLAAAIIKQRLESILENTDSYLYNKIRPTSIETLKFASIMQTRAQIVTFDTVALPAAGDRPRIRIG